MTRRRRWTGPVRVHQDLITGERALRHNAANLGAPAASSSCRWAPALLSGADVVLLQLPKTLAELEEIADAVARHAAPDVVLLAGGRVKHMSPGHERRAGALLQRGPAPAGPAKIPASSLARGPQARHRRPAVPGHRRQQPNWA